MSYINFRSRIIETLAPLVTAKKIKKIYDYEPEKINGFPCISVVASGNGEAFHSTANNMLVYNFLILLFDDISSKNDTKSTVETRVLELADSVLEYLRKMSIEDLNGFLPITTVGGAKYLKRGSGNARAFEMKFQVQKKLPRN